VSIRLDRDTAEPGRPAPLSIDDDGVGFVAEEGLAREGHFGLRVLTDLARDAGAALRLATAPGHGTHWRLGLSGESGKHAAIRESS
jgi:nitrate/nitrite-specific signal transduction histidine kinase